NYKGSGKRKIMRNDCQHHETQMGIRLESWELDPKWVLYRDRGFATSKPITAQYHFPNEKTLCLRTEYNGSVFEEEVKFIGEKYRTRQSVISRAGEQVMIGQYLEKRI
ncbi:MAG: phycobiliprotein lyase, partial [Rivularia sp. ALOHA_DT_140]|nr:phycobiliprotein lyase [Rivularia sp. ALOHA_DT_140]